MLSVRSKSDKVLMQKLYRQATQLALNPRVSNHRKHAIIAETLRNAINEMVIWEEYAPIGNSICRRED